MKKLLLLLLIFALALPAYGYVTLCPAGCDYSTLYDAGQYLNNTGDTLVINESGSYAMPGAKTYYVYDTSTVVSTISSTDGVIRITADDVYLNFNGTVFYGTNNARNQINGSGLYINASNNVTVANAGFYNYTYGAIVRYSNATILDTVTLANNRYGAYDFMDSDATLSASVISANMYGIQVDSGLSSLDTNTRAKLIGSTVSSNTVDAITVNYAVIDIRESAIENNGGGIADTGLLVQFESIANVTNTSFDSNDDQGIYLWTDATGNFHNITIINQSYAIVTEDNINLTITDSTLGNATYLFYDYEGSSVTLINCSISTLASATDFTVNDNDGAVSYFVFRNTSYNPGKVVFGDSASTLSTLWQLKFTLSNSSGSLDQANATLTDIDGTIRASYLTDVSGNTPWMPLIATEYSGAGLNSFNNYTLESYLAGHVRSFTSFFFATNRWLNVTVPLQNGVMPTYSTFGAGTTDFTAEADLESVTDAFLNKSAGSITFFNSQNFSGADLDGDLSISFGLVGLNSTGLPTLNVSARISIYNVNCPVSTVYYSENYFSARESALANAIDCGGLCTFKTCSAGTLSFNVSSFSSYAIADAANLTVWDTTDSINRTLNQKVKFYANFTNNTNPITTATCGISLPGSSSSMSYNATSELWEYNKSFAKAQNTAFNISCDGLASGFDIVNASDNFTVYNDTTAPTVSVLAWLYNQSAVSDPVWLTIIASDSMDAILDVTLSVLNSSGSAVLTTTNWSRTGTRYNFSFSVPSIAEGFYTINITATDDSGNMDYDTDSLEVGVFTDVIAPARTLVYPTNGSSLPTGTTTTYLNISTDEIASCKWSTSTGFDFASSGTAFSTTNNINHYYSYSPLSNGGSYTLYYKCNDSANNINVLSVVHSFGVTSDTTSPNISYSPPTPDDASTIIVNYVNVKVTTNETANGTLVFGGTSYTLKNSTGGNTGTVLNRTIYGLADALYSYYVRVYDADANSAVAATRTVTVDSTGPIITFASPTNYSTLTDISNVYLSLTTSEASTCSITSRKLSSSAVGTTVALTPANAANTSFSKYYNASSDSSGYDFYFAVQCTDRTSHVSSKTTYFKLNDTTAPSITFRSPSPSSGGGAASSTVRINITTSEALGSIKNIKVDGGSYSAMSTGSGYYYYTFTSLNDSQHIVKVNVSDWKGNLRSSTLTFTVDTEYPEMEIISPDDDSTVKNCVGVVLNVTTDEEATCEFIWFVDEEETCVTECEDDYDKCYERADDSTERSECNDEQDDCEDDCVAEQYNDYEDGDLDEEDRDVCDECLDTCENVCDDELDECMDDADDDDEEDDCDDDYDECVEEDCVDDCEDLCIWAYSLEWEECVENGDYRLTFTCEDDAGNSNSSNSSFTMKDTLAPVITQLTKSRTVSSDSFTLSATTSEPGICKYSTTKTVFADMENELTGSSTTHTKVISFTKPGKYTYYVACNDSNNNKMTYSNSTTVDVKMTSNPYSYKTQNLVTGENTLVFDEETPVSSLKLKLKEAANDETVEIEVLPSQPSAVTTPNGKVYKYIDIKHTNLASKLESAEITFRVPKSWISSEGVSASQVVMYHYSNGWVELPTPKDTEDALNILFKATTTSFSYFAIAAKPSTSTTTPTDSTPQTDTTTPPTTDQPAATDDTPPDWPESDGGTSWWLWVVIAIVGLGLAGGTVYMVIQGPPKRTERIETKVEKKQETKHEKLAPLTETEEIVKSGLDNGLTMDQLWESFKTNGWSDEDFHDVYSSYLHKTGQDKKEEPEEADSVDISEFIKQSLMHGMSPQDLVAMLIDNGWPAEESQKRVAEYAVQGEPEEKVQDPAPDLGRYIREAIDKGRTNHDLAVELINAGWPKQMILEELRALEDEKSDPMAFVQSQLKAGVPRADIEKSLLDSGWEKEDVDELF